jgi:hypothetical protein
VPVSSLYSPHSFKAGHKLTFITGSGCVAALEAEKYLAEIDDSVGNELETENQAEKSQTNGVVPEYRSNPLL